MKKKEYAIFWNLEQCSFYAKNRCKVVDVGREYSERLGKIGVFCVFEMDDVFAEVHRIWNSRKRQE